MELNSPLAWETLWPQESDQVSQWGWPISFTIHLIWRQVGLGSFTGHISLAPCNRHQEHWGIKLLNILFSDSWLSMDSWTTWKNDFPLPSSIIISKLVWTNSDWFVFLVSSLYRHGTAVISPTCKLKSCQCWERLSFINNQLKRRLYSSGLSFINNQL